MYQVGYFLKYNTSPTIFCVLSVVFSLKYIPDIAALIDVNPRSVANVLGNGQLSTL